MTELQRIGKHIRSIREKLHMTRDELERLSGVSKASIERLESGNRWPRFPNYVAICQALGLDPFNVYIYTVHPCTPDEPTAYKAERRTVCLNR